MHTIKLNVGDNLYTHLMFLLKNLNTNEIQIIEDVAKEQDKTTSSIDMSHYKIEAFKSIKDPLEWQQDIRSEWD